MPDVGTLKAMFVPTLRTTYNTDLGTAWAQATPVIRAWALTHLPAPAAGTIRDVNSEIYCYLLDFFGYQSFPLL